MLLHIRLRHFLIPSSLWRLLFEHSLYSSPTHLHNLPMDEKAISAKLKSHFPPRWRSDEEEHQQIDKNSEKMNDSLHKQTAQAKVKQSSKLVASAASSGCS